MVMAALEAELEDEVAGRQHATKASVPAYSDLTALPPCWKYALEAIIKVLLYFIVHDNCLLFML